VNNLNLLGVRVLWHHELSRSVLNVIIYLRLSQILVNILHRLVIRLAGLLIIIRKKLEESIVGHIFSRLNETLSLQFNVGLLCHKLLIKSLLNLNFLTFQVRIQIRHIREAHPDLRRLIKGLLGRVSARYLKRLCTFQVSIVDLRCHVVLGYLGTKKLLNCLNSPKLVQLLIGLFR
jgi:hypothetical protein